MKKWFKSVLVILGAVVLSTVAISATDMAAGVRSNLSGLIPQAQQGVCTEGAQQFLFGAYSVCADTFEASAGEGCPYRDPQSQIETQENANAGGCSPVSVAGVLPWRFVSLTQAQQLCGRVGKRLPSNEEWYKMASGMTDVSSCHINTGKSAPEPTGSAQCQTPAGLSDMVGNVWEWVDDQVTFGKYEGRELPPSGFVSLVDSSGVVVTTQSVPSTEFGEDYAWTESGDIRGIIRGGFYGNGNDAGIFAQNLSVPLDFRTTGVGFRCVRDL